MLLVVNFRNKLKGLLNFSLIINNSYLNNTSKKLFSNNNNIVNK